MKEKPILPYALHPLDQRRVTVDEFLQDARAPDAMSRATALCPLCGEDVYVARLHDRAHTQQFSHVAGERARCPLVNSRLHDMTFMSIYCHDEERTRRQRGAFIGHWRHHLMAIRQHAPVFSVQRFTQVIEYADVLHLWSCPTLVQEDVPYILLTLASFIAEMPGTAHPTWLRFVFDASVREAIDLRKPGRTPPRFFRLHYRSSFTSMFPDARHLLEWIDVPMTGDFLHQTPRITLPEATAFDAFIKRQRESESEAADDLPRSQD